MACDRLNDYLAGREMQVPQICLGAEVAYHNGLIYDEQLEQLCIGASKYLLLELPFGKWTPNLLRDVQAFQRVRGITPILAHLERYFSCQDKRLISAMMDSDAFIQMNAEFLLDFWKFQKGKRLIRQGFVHVMGTDSHNMTDRTPNLGMAVERLERAGMSGYVNQICQVSGEIFQAGAGKEGYEQS